MSQIRYFKGFSLDYDIFLKQNNKMSRNKLKSIKGAKEIKSNEESIFKVLTKQQKVNGLLNHVNEFIYDSLQTGRLNIKDPKKTAKILIKRSNKSIVDQIINGDFQISQNKVSYNISRRSLKHHNGIQDDFQDFYSTNEKLVANSIKKDLKEMHQSLLRQKQLENGNKKILEQKARQFVGRMKKDKEEFKQKLKSKKEQSRIFVRAFSEDVITSMKNKLELKLLQKRKKLAEKVQIIEKRKSERLTNEVNQQISYWQSVKNYQSLKQLRKQEEPENTALPQIKLMMSPSPESRIKPSLSGISQESKSASILNKKFRDIDNYVLKAKLKFQNFKTKLNNQKDNSKEKNQITPSSSRNNKSQLHNKSILKINPEIEDHRFNHLKKLKPNDEQKESKNLRYASLKNPGEKAVHKVKINHPLIYPSLVSSSQNINSNDNLQVKANNIKPSKNPLQISLENSWNQTLNKIAFHQMDKIKGLSLLGQIEKKLYKYNKEGIVIRLKRKVQVIENLQKDVNLTHKNEQSLKKIQDGGRFTISDTEDKYITSFARYQVKIQEGLMENDRNLLSSRNQFFSNQQVEQKENI